MHYLKKDLFSVRPPAILVHAVNCRGVMAHGIAKDFKKRFPVAFKHYELDCRVFKERLRGKAAIYSGGGGYTMGCLFTSVSYGPQKDDEKDILGATDSALKHFLDIVAPIQGAVVYSNKFNSGLFNVAWYKTEEILAKHFGADSRPSWTVCSPRGEVKP